MAIDSSDIQGLLREARQALHKLRTGTSVVEVDCSDYRARFTPATLGDLQAYVAELETRLDGRPVRGAIGFTF